MMNLPSRSVFRVLHCIAFGLATIAISSADTPRFIPATPENTRMADGSPLPEKSESIGWKWLPDAGNHGVWESLPPAKGGIQPTLMVLAGGLKAGASYDVFGCFWSDGVEGGTNEKTRRFGPVRFGLTLALLASFDSVATDRHQHLQWIIRPGSKLGSAYGLEMVAEETPPVTEGLEKTTMEGGGRIFRARLGAGRAAADGTLPVFFADMPYEFPGVARIAGVWLRPAAGDQPQPPAIHPETILHLAIRAGDPITIGRELEAGADVNALDEDGMTALFYAAAADDPKLVRRLLDRGANPNLATQSVPPLTAAAMVPSVEIVSMLLEAGAVVPASSYKKAEKLNRPTDPRFFHPVVAAINSGSLPVLKQLLEKVPNLDIQSLFLAVNPPVEDSEGSLISLTPFIVAGAVGSRQWKLAAFLIDKGCNPTVPQPNRRRFYPDGKDYPHGFLMAWAAAAGEEGLPVIEALIRRGLSPVIERDNPPQQGDSPEWDGVEYRLSPGWDAPSSAILAGQVSLVAKFLPVASKINRIAQGRLLSLALYSGNPQVIEMVRSQYPNAQIKRWKPANISGNPSDGLDDESLRLLLPRTKPSPAKTAGSEKQEKVLAVIASPEAAGPGAVLAASASGKAGWKVVDRDEIQTALQESRIAMPWLDGRHSLSELGDRLTADVLVIASKIKGQAHGLYRFEAVEVATGLEIHREHYRDDAFNPDKDLPPFLARSAEALERARNHQRRQAVSLISFTARSELPNSSAVARMLGASMRREIDDTPGFISLSRSQAGRLVEEQALKGAQSIWGATHLLEGAAASAEDGKIKVALRLETFRENGKVQHDVEVTGSAANLPELAASAWRKLLVAAEGQKASPDTTPRQSPQTAQKEAERLLREAEWMMYTRVNVKEVIPMLEAAAALGAPLDQVMTLHLDCLFQDIGHFNWLANGSPIRVTRIAYLEYILTQLPLSLNYSDRIVGSLPKLEKLLQQTAFYFQQIGSRSLDQPVRHTKAHDEYQSKEFWYVIQFLSFCRAAVYSEELSAPQRSELQAFGEELDQLTNAYFTKLVRTNKPSYWRYRLFELDKHVLARNPELAKGIVRMVASGAAPISAFFSGGYGLHGNDISGWLSPERLLVKTLLEILPSTSLPNRNLLQAQAECLLAAPEEIPQAFRRVMVARATELAANRGMLTEPEFLFPLLRKHTLGIFFDGFWWPIPLYHGGVAIPDLVHSPRAAPDFMMRHSTYTNLVTRYGATNTNAGLKMKEYRSLNYQGELDNLATQRIRGGKTETIRDLRDAAFMWDMITGQWIQEPFINNHRQYLMPPGKSGPTSAAATLLVDLRTVSGGANGFAFQPVRDSSSPSLLWLRFLPIEGHVIPTTHSSNHKEIGEAKQPWLLAVDCDQQKIRHQLNLATAESLPNTKTSPGWILNSPITPLVQSRSHFLTNVNWGDPGQHPKSKVAVLIDKSTGTMKTLPGDMVITEGADWFGVSAISLEDDFYFLRETKEIRRGMFINNIRGLYHLDAKGAIRALTEYGRRPELTPFDAEDRWPKAIERNGKNVLVFNSTEYFGEFNPADQSWKTLPWDSKHQNLVRGMSAKRLNGGFETITRIDGRDNGGAWRIDRDSLLPGTLNCSHPKHGKRQIRIGVKLPDDFVNQVKYASVANPGRDGNVETKILPHAAHVKDEPLYLAVVHQTRDHLILALQFETRYVGGQWGNRFLPFLWKLPKQDLFNLLDDGSGQ